MSYLNFKCSRYKYKWDCDVYLPVSEVDLVSVVPTDVAIVWDLVDSVDVYLVFPDDLVVEWMDVDDAISVYDETVDDASNVFVVDSLKVGEFVVDSWYIDVDVVLEFIDDDVTGS